MPENMPDPGAPPAGAPPVIPPAGAPPAAGAPPSAGPPAAAAAAPRSKKDYLRISKQALATRLARASSEKAAELIKQELGCTLEEAKKVIAAQRATAGAAPAAGDPGTPPAPGSAAAAREQELLAENQRLKQEAEERERKNKMARNRQKDERLLAEIRMEAVRAGITDERAIRMAVGEYRAAVIGTADGEAPPQPGTFFNEFLKTYPQLGSANRPPEMVDQHPNTAPAGGAPPPPVAPPGGPRPPVNTERLDDREFAQRTKSKYGYTPGTY